MYKHGMAEFDAPYRPAAVVQPEIEALLEHNPKGMAASSCSRTPRQDSQLPIYVCRIIRF